MGKLSMMVGRNGNLFGYLFLFSTTLFGDRSEQSESTECSS